MCVSSDCRIWRSSTVKRRRRLICCWSNTDWCDLKLNNLTSSESEQLVYNPCVCVCSVCRQRQWWWLGQTLLWGELEADLLPERETACQQGEHISWSSATPIQTNQSCLLTTRFRTYSVVPYLEIKSLFLMILLLRVVCDLSQSVLFCGVLSGCSLWVWLGSRCSPSWSAAVCPAAGRGVSLSESTRSHKGGGSAKTPNGSPWTTSVCRLSRRSATRWHTHIPFTLIYKCITTSVSFQDVLHSCSSTHWPPDAAKSHYATS